MERGVQGDYIPSTAMPETFLAFVPRPLPPVPPLYSNFADRTDGHQANRFPATLILTASEPNHKNLKILAKLVNGLFVYRLCSATLLYNILSERLQVVF